MTRNLHDVLCEFAEGDVREKVFWIDAICINQADIIERVHQAKLMTKIYRNSSRVVAWIGPATQFSSRAMRRIKDFADSIDLDWARFEIKSRTSLPWQKLASALLAGSDGVNDLAELLRRPYFERLWIWQEVRVANGQAIVKCGQEVMLWQDFHKAVFALRKTGHPNFSCRHIMRRMADVVQMKNMASSTSLVSLTAWTRKAKCGDQRDRIYAVQSMI